MELSRTIRDSGRFFSQHAGATVYYDSRHKVSKVPMEGGYIFEMVQERQPDGTYRVQLLALRSPSGETSVISYDAYKMFLLKKGQNK